MAGMMGQFDLMFIDMMIPHHASAVAMAQVALTRAEHPELRALAEAHHRESERRDRSDAGLAGRSGSRTHPRCP